MHSKLLIKRQFSWTLAAVILMGFFWLWFTPAVHADAIPDPQNAEGDGRNPAPDQITQVQMASEKVIINIQKVWVADVNPTQQVWGGHVTADFTLHNPNSQDENLPVGFPLFLGQGIVIEGFEEVLDLKVFVNSIQLPTREITINSKRWAIWDMTIPNGDTQLKVTYDMRALDGYTAARFGYILHTGAPWAGPIGQGDIIVHFPYLAEDLFVDSKATTSGYTVSDFDINWHFENLEPTPANDILLTVVNPNVWGNVAEARKAVLHEKTAQNYWDLARAYASIIENYDSSSAVIGPLNFYSPSLAQTAEAQYLKALDLNPTNTRLRQEVKEFVWKWIGTLLPDKDAIVLTQLANPTYPTGTSFPSATAGTPLLPPSATHFTIVPTPVRQITPTLAPVIASIAPSPPNTTVPLAPSTVTPISETNAAITTTPILIAATILVILLGLGIALRRKK